PDLAHCRGNLAELWLDRKEYARARQLVIAALAGFAALPRRDPHGEANAHYLLGRAAGGLGDLAEARREIDRALRGIETLRAGLGDETLTLSFFALRQLYFDGAIQVLMDLDARYPGSAFATLALEASERSRMRTLLDEIVARRRRE